MHCGQKTIIFVFLFVPQNSNEWASAVMDSEDCVWSVWAEPKSISFSTARSSPVKRIFSGCYLKEIIIV